MRPAGQTFKSWLCEVSPERRWHAGFSTLLQPRLRCWEGGGGLLTANSPRWPVERPGRVRGEPAACWRGHRASAASASRNRCRSASASSTSTWKLNRCTRLRHLAQRALHPQRSSPPGARPSSQRPPPARGQAGGRQQRGHRAGSVGAVACRPARQFGASPGVRRPTRPACVGPRRRPPDARPDQPVPDRAARRSTSSAWSTTSGCTYAAAGSARGSGQGSWWPGALPLPTVAPRQAPRAAAVVVEVRVHSDWLRLRVEDDGGGAPDTSCGLAGGVLTAGPAGRGWSVCAELPLAGVRR